jgi:hypothetical protein
LPYIPESDRKHFDPYIDALAVAISTPGEFNYVISALIQRIIEDFDDPVHYEDYNSILGVLDAAKLEYYARVMRVYEDAKKDENGDVYGEVGAACMTARYNPKTHIVR